MENKMKMAFIVEIYVKTSPSKPSQAQATIVFIKSKAIVEANPIKTKAAPSKTCFPKQTKPKHKLLLSFYLSKAFYKSIL